MLKTIEWTFEKDIEREGKDKQNTCGGGKILRKKRDADKRKK